MFIRRCCYFRKSASPSPVRKSLSEATLDSLRYSVRRKLGFHGIDIDPRDTSQSSFYFFSFFSFILDAPSDVENPRRHDGDLDSREKKKNVLCSLRFRETRVFEFRMISHSSRHWSFLEAATSVFHARGCPLYL